MNICFEFSVCLFSYDFKNFVPIEYLKAFFSLTKIGGGREKRDGEGYKGKGIR